SSARQVSESIESRSPEPVSFPENAPPSPCCTAAAGSQGLKSSTDTSSAPTQGNGSRVCIVTSPRASANGAPVTFSSLPTRCASSRALPRPEPDSTTPDDVSAPSTMGISVSPRTTASSSNGPDTPYVSANSSASEPPSIEPVNDSGPSNSQRPVARVSPSGPLSSMPSSASAPEPVDGSNRSFSGPAPITRPQYR